VKRTWLDKADGSQRPTGMPAFEDNIVQRAVTMLRGAVDEQDFYDFSHGSREGHSPHQIIRVNASGNCWPMSKHISR
jgi:retron-type reverse transcriptase